MRRRIMGLLCGLLCCLTLAGCGGDGGTRDDYALYFQVRDLETAAGDGGPAGGALDAAGAEPGHGGPGGDVDGGAAGGTPG